MRAYCTKTQGPKIEPLIEQGRKAGAEMVALVGLGTMAVFLGILFGAGAFG